ncbi:hypothetical protein [Candidatus Xiphinematobacter sp. Idaho Grape]|uniref:hypothetical protein n=1 Tax=Candidatus Xiphinematobacter sp. Idaho Grape TaxID=1704307 RepID=UPI00130D9696|nr:hypothetical protein [Candidatus Xiphinematobacter sp. Idaho Grape]
MPVGKTSAQTPANFCGASELLFEGILCWCERLYGFTVVVLGCFDPAEAAEKLGADHCCEIPFIPNAFRVALEQKGAVAICGIDYPTPDSACIRDYTRVLGTLLRPILLFLRPQKVPGTTFRGRGNNFPCRR